MAKRLKIEGVCDKKITCCAECFLLNSSYHIQQQDECKIVKDEITPEDLDAYNEGRLFIIMRPNCPLPDWEE